MKEKITRLPAVPLITHDPDFSIWVCGPTPTAGEPRHWSGMVKELRGTVTVDGIPVRFLGVGARQSMNCVETNLTPLSTEYVYEDLGIRLTVRYTSPLLLDDLDILSTPISYIEFDVAHMDGKAHQVEVSFTVLESVCCGTEIAPKMRSDTFTDQGLQFAYIGQARQKPLSGSGDHFTADWGYAFLCAADGVVDDRLGNKRGVRYRKAADTPFHSTLMFGYDDVASIHYFGRMLPAYYARKGKNIRQAFLEFHQRQEEILGRCREFDSQLLAQAEALGGEDYQLILCASYRQSIAAHKLVESSEGELLFISKENDSNACAATVDVSYPSIPLYLLYNPELVRAMCRPVLKFAGMPVWNYDFAPHDVGRYPVLNGQIYAAKLRELDFANGDTVAPYYLYPDTVDAYDLSQQMPVEECGNMLLMLYAAGYADGDYSLAEAHLPTLRSWCAYLLKYGEDPGEQLCTDDFAGHLAHNVNLSAKAVMGIAAFSKLLEVLGYRQEAAQYWEKAKTMAQSWLQRAFNGQYSALTFDGLGWSMKYNLVWDRLFGWDLLPDSFYEKELQSYLPRVNPYGLPLDSRCASGKSDWILWVAAMLERREDFAVLAGSVANYLRQSRSQVPFSDYYNTVTGAYERFIARSVQGGNFMPLLMQRWKKEK